MMTALAFTTIDQGETDTELCAAVRTPLLGKDSGPMVRSAIAACERLLNHDSSNVAARRNLAHALGRINRHEDAVRAYDDLIRQVPDDYEAWINKGLQLHTLERYDDALEPLRQAATLRPDHPGTMFQVGLTLQALGRHDEALVWLGRTRDVDPTSDSAWGFMAKSLAALGRHDEAISHWDRANQLHPARRFVGEAGQEQLYAHSLDRAGRQPAAETSRQLRWLVAAAMIAVAVAVLVYAWRQRIHRRAA